MSTESCRISRRTIFSVTRVRCLAEQWRYERHPPAGLSARTLEPILEIGVLKIPQVESCRMLHEADTRGVGHAPRKEAVDERDDAPENVDQNSHREFGQERPAGLIGRRAAIVGVSLARRREHQEHNHR
jgi:hypothetical protein